MTEALDVAALTDYLRGRLPSFSGPIQATKFSGGQSNPTFRLSTPHSDYVLRRKPPGKLLKSAHAVDREFRVMQALAETDVPVPAVHLLCDDEDIIGSMFFVMEYVEGRIFWNAALPELDNPERAATYSAMNRVLAALHAVDYAHAGLADFGKPGDYFARQLARWTGQYRASETDPIPQMDRLIDWLKQNLPGDDGRTALIHGDFRLDNMIFHPSEPRVLALLDWELSTLGHPYADLAYQCMQLRVPTDLTIPGLGGVDRAALGIPSEAAYVEEYCRRRGLDGIANWNFYLAFSFFRLVAILQGVKKRALDGNASSEKALRYGEMAAPLAAIGVDLIE